MSKIYAVKPEYLEYWGADESTIILEEEVEQFAYEWDKTVEDLLEQLEEVEKSPRKAVGTIETEIGTMTIYFNGDGEPLTAEIGDTVEEIGCTVHGISDAIDIACAMYSGAPWFLELVEEEAE